MAEEACGGGQGEYPDLMVALAEIQKQADDLSLEDREGLLAYLLHSLPGVPEGPDDEEVMRRDSEMESGAVKALSQEEFVSQVGRGG